MEDRGMVLDKINKMCNMLRGLACCSKSFCGI